MRTPGSTPVVVGLSGTAAGVAAVRLGAREAVARGRSLKVVHAFAWAGPDTHGGHRDWASARRAATQLTRTALTTARRTSPGVRVVTELLDGSPTRVLVQQSRAADLVVLGDGAPPAAGGMPAHDSTLMQVVSRAWCPALVARGPRPPSGRVVAAVDGSAAALEALRHAGDEARRRRLGVDVVHVIAEPAPEAQARGREVLAAAVAAVPGLPSVRTRLLTGDPARVLERASRHARLLVIGPRGADGATLLGPVATHLLRRCACPTLFVHGSTAQWRCAAGTAHAAGTAAD
ncbi:universal stress protein [Mangrovihabitans endophyticus]|uniref:UspA domain-containing protein n=1 Tax=Mangrovihabitans endophyticus TaxID=1751298 RepID=A0A8J3C7T6_9ACTN|nr:universal stress protein [Mangrovihabitans endophyticus]GGL17485.1 hypothetical protein GCM10012284_60030 [Mangrovihabitans endophyticus]